jgi:hypothetical protein
MANHPDKIFMPFKLLYGLAVEVKNLFHLQGREVLIFLIHSLTDLVVVSNHESSHSVDDYEKRFINFTGRQ